MLAAKSLPAVCLPCRLQISASQFRNAAPIARTQRLQSKVRTTTSRRRAGRTFTTTATTRRDEGGTETFLGGSQDAAFYDDDAHAPKLTIEERVRGARQLFGDALPRGALKEEEYVVYERLYGRPVFVEGMEEIEALKGIGITGAGEAEGEEGEGEEVFEEEETGEGGSVLLRRLSDGRFEEVEVFDEFYEEEEDGDTEVEGRSEVGEGEGEGEGMTREEWEAIRERRAERYHREVYDKSVAAYMEERMMEEEEEAQQQEGEEEEDDDFMRAHPLTVAGRFKPSPSTVFLPKETLVDPVAEMLTRANHKHLAESSKNIFGGNGLPYSATTPAAYLNKEQKPIPLDPSMADMGNIESDSYLAAVMPGTYATVMSTLVEVRKRLGTPWIEHLLKKKGGPLVLDAGAGGAGVLAWHEVLRAEWARMHEESGNVSQDAAPLGKSTVLTASSTLRHRASRLLENTTFIPRLPDLDAKGVRDEVDNEINVQQPRKLYDLIIAPHTLWPLKQEYQRKEQVEKYWSLLNPKGGVLIILEKGLPRGFEVVAAAREFLLEKRIKSPDAAATASGQEAAAGQPQTGDDDADLRETGMIIAPCTNHGRCPMYKSPGVSLGRKDFCFFSQRYIRPPYLQRILNATDRNHEDVQFSYLAVQRGRDQRLPLHDLLGKGVVQGEAATLKAFEGHEWKLASPDSTSTYTNASPSTDAPEAESQPLVVEPQTPLDVNPLTLPRLILPALKRRGHIVMDVCTPSATLERWTVPRSFSRQAFRDARKAQWGDLWALGAKTRIERSVRLGRPRDEFDKKGRRIKKQKQQTIEIDVGDEGGVQGMRAKRDGRFDGEGWDRKIRGSGGRKGRRKSVRSGEEVLEEMV